MCMHMHPRMYVLVTCIHVVGTRKVGGFGPVSVTTSSFGLLALAIHWLGIRFS